MHRLISTLRRYAPMIEKAAKMLQGNNKSTGRRRR